MTFTSFEYLVLLLSTFSVYYLLPWRARILLLLLANYVFYCYWKPTYAYIIGSTTLVDYWAGRAMDATGSKGRRKAVLLASVAVNLGMLGYFKYTNFALETLGPLLGSLGFHAPSLGVVLPVGISFYTFQEMSYTIDVYRRRVPAEKDLALFAAYVSFFPQLVAGPIERAGTLLTQLAVRQAFDFQRTCDGVGLIFIGLAKKLVISDRLSYFALPKFANPGAHDGLQIALAAVAMPISLYLDFGAYSDIARGSAKTLGIELSRNFYFPSMHRNPAEFWQRWHITLGTWVRDYVFLPLGGMTRRSPGRLVGITLLAMTLIGLWHGASWHFVVWGVGNGMALSAYYLYRLRRRRRGRESRLGILMSWLCATTFQILLGVLFFVPGLREAGLFWARLFSAPWSSWGDPAATGLLAFLVLFFTVQFLGNNLDYRGLWDRVPAPVRGLAFALLFYAVLFGAVPTAQRFVYYRF